MRDFSSNHAALALNTATLGHNLDGYGAGWSPEQVIDACAARGYGAIVFWRREVGARGCEIGERVRAAGMQVAGLCRTPFLTGRDAGSDDEVRSAIDMAAALGAEVLTIVTGGTEPGTKGLTETRKRLTARLAGHAEYAAQCGVKLGLEPLNPMLGGNRTCLMTARDALEICDEIDAPNIGIAVDVYHVWWDRMLPQSLLAAAPDRILSYHLCDWLENTSDMLLDRGMMGDGVADLKAIRMAVESAGYAGFCEVEVFSAEKWWKRPPNEVLDVIVDRFRTVC
ncbi:sugar phosphate isomerase/epimerase family protein [Pseudohoeflea coraliihabitans]|uniref:Sugar phosphate isomerase/epimerase n=1 Tax=Pseudohoeflea coraliihabitans TaxID=2860393 RepID=A0ABS6WPU4_9HYPH|nr:sugar phosphate isomerase/epimerase family protein [Pseudohoeflea sp. DP4N28-3]MBW3097982.1 sugar phosphate isomerase/epimerase [Pseudohoeflea sp. DP4N28-3]